MSLSNPNKPVTEQRLQEFYHEIEPYMGNEGGGTGGGHTIEDSEGTDLEQRDTLQFGDGFKATDDSENEKTVVEPNLMTAADMDDVVTPLPSVRSSYQKYSTEEQIVGEWIDGKPIYQKTIVTETPIVSVDGTLETAWIPVGVSIDKYVGSYVFINNGNANHCLPYLWVIVQDNSLRYLTYGLYTNNYAAHPNNVMLQCNSAANGGKPAWVTIRYTKTTS